MCWGGQLNNLTSCPNLHFLIISEIKWNHKFSTWFLYKKLYSLWHVQAGTDSVNGPDFKPTYLSLKTAQGKHFLSHRLTEYVALGTQNPSEVLSSLLMSAAGILCLIYLCIVRSITSALDFKQASLYLGKRSSLHYLSSSKTFCILLVFRLDSNIQFFSGMALLLYEKSSLKKKSN